jgi:hypothetical protein
VAAIEGGPTQVGYWPVSVNWHIAGDKVDLSAHKYIALRARDPSGVRDAGQRSLTGEKGLSTLSLSGLCDLLHRMNLCRTGRAGGAPQLAR